MLGVLWLKETQTIPTTRRKYIEPLMVQFFQPMLDHIVGRCVVCNPPCRKAMKTGEI